jgi:uncharacterized protein (TIGR02270 family)
MERAPLTAVVQQHAEEAAMLRHVRSVLVRAPHIKLLQLRRLDERIAAHLDGLAVAGRHGTAVCAAALDRLGAGEVFALAVRLIDERDARRLERLVELAAESSDALRGLVSALGWVSVGALRGLVHGLLTTGDVLRCRVGLTACRLHRVDPGPGLTTALGSSDALLRSEALRTAAELGRTDLLPQALNLLQEPAPDASLRAAVSACLLGDRAQAVMRLDNFVLSDGAHQDEAAAWLLPVVEFGRGREVLLAMARRAHRPGLAHKRRIVRASGWLGDAQYVPWLIDLMADDALARLAGASFALITGADLSKLDLERPQPEPLQSDASEDSADEDVSLDEDESLPWPDRDKVQLWWRHHARSMPANMRSFMGAAPSVSHAEQVLREGYQRQRVVAARHRVWCQPGTPLFPVCAPAWRQQRSLAT